MPMPPPHPGDLIRTEIIEALSLTVSAAAKILKVRRPTLSDLLNGKAALSPDTALRLEKAFRVDTEHLLRMQIAYDVAQARPAYRRAVEKGGAYAFDSVSAGDAAPFPMPARK